jgi:hypothetical protein
MAVGAVAGAMATGPQSAVVWGLRRVGIYHGKPPPEAVSERPNDAAVQAGVLPPSFRGPAMVTEHIGFGAAAGALYGLLSTAIRPTPVTGVLTGLAIWLTSYKGWIPALHIMPPPERDERGRQAALVIAHIAYGLSLAATYRRLQPDA